MKKDRKTLGNVEWLHETPHSECLTALQEAHTVALEYVDPHDPEGGKGIWVVGTPYRLSCTAVWLLLPTGESEEIELDGIFNQAEHA